MLVTLSFKVKPASLRSYEYEYEKGVVSRFMNARSLGSAQCNSRVAVPEPWVTESHHGGGCYRANCASPLLCHQAMRTSTCVQLGSDLVRRI